MATFEVAVVRATDFCIGVQFYFAALLPSLSGGTVTGGTVTGGTVGPFQLHPVDPDSGRVAVAVFCLPRVVRIPKCFEVSVVRLFLLYRKLTNRIGGDLKGDFDRFGVLDGSRDLMSADGWPLESPVSALD